jgi:hypothetical protein
MVKHCPVQGEDIQFESESIVEVVSNVLTLIDIEGYNLTRL